jgi:DNA helicase-2/ATP-dependent DNA helicase PcrA
MIKWHDFEDAVVTKLDSDIRKSKNVDQHDAIKAPLDQSLFIVAGPGSGKTTVIALRVIKLILIDGIKPSGILVTTFTRKAAEELRSRILGWGDEIRNLFANSKKYTKYKTKLKKIDFNKINTGTLDSITEEALTDHRKPGTPPPVVIEDFVSNALMIRRGLFTNGRFKSNSVESYLQTLLGINRKFNTSKKSDFLVQIKDRFYHDRIDVNSLKTNKNNQGLNKISNAIDDYIDELDINLIYDYSKLEDKFLEKLSKGELDSFRNEIKFLLIDEYQDTNLLQEKIYFEIAKSVLNNNGSVALVGDDDQSLYRFRGATVQLFRDYRKRIITQVGIKPKKIYLNKNYRSTNNIIDFCNDFISLDNDLQKARVKNKPIIKCKRKNFIDYPVLGMFRDNVNILAEDLSNFIDKVYNGKGFNVMDKDGNKYNINIDSSKGDPGDIAFLSQSPKELDSNNNPKLPLLLRRNLPNNISVYNPRGQDLQRYYSVQILCGLLLECIDPNNAVISNISNLPNDAIDTFDIWRNQAKQYIKTNPEPNKKRSLSDFVNAWKKRKPLGRKKWDEKELPIISIVYKLVTWIPEMRDELEDIVHLEAITRTITQASLFSSFGAKLIFDNSNPSLEKKSIEEAIWSIFVPIATGSIDLDEDLFETLPRDKINIMSIHQAKGLEFPLTIVDVGSDLRCKHYSQSFKRYPEEGTNGYVKFNKSVNMEDEFRPFSPIGKPNRSSIDRAFDDLYRKYFVAFSRAQDVLILVGLNSVLDSYRDNYGNEKLIPNIATGWDRYGNWIWKRNLSNLVHI